LLVEVILSVTVETMQPIFGSGLCEPDGIVSNGLAAASAGLGMGRKDYDQRARKDKAKNVSNELKE